MGLNDVVTSHVWQKLLTGGMVTKTMASEVHALDKAKGILEA